MDIPYLTAAFVEEFAKRFDKLVTGIAPGAERLLLNAPWPGNIRELRNVLERACMLSEGRILSEREVLDALGSDASTPASIAPATSAAPAERPELDRHTIEQALQRAGGNRSVVAKQLGISRRTLSRRLATLGLRSPPRAAMWAPWAPRRARPAAHPPRIRHDRRTR